MIFSWNIFLAFIWLAAWGTTSVPQFFIGFVIAFALLYFLEGLGLMGRSQYTRKVLGLFGLFFFFLKELWKSNTRVAIDLFRPKMKITPAIVAVPIELKKDWSLTAMANLITLTPGTLSLDLSEDRKTLFIHPMYLDGSDKEAFIKDIKEGFESRLLFLENEAPV